MKNRYSEEKTSCSTGWKRVLKAAAVIAVLWGMPDVSSGATILVNSTNDPAGYNTNLTVGTLGSTVTLRDAVTAANNTPGDDTITFDPSLGGKTIPLSQSGLFIPHVTGVVTNDDNTALYLTSNIAILGPSGGVTLLRDTGGQRLVCVAQGATVALTGLTLQSGSASSGGGGVWNEGALTIDGVRFQSCGSVPRGPPYYDLSGFGGGIHNVGSLTFRNSSMIFNYAGAVGGGIYNAPGAALDVTNSYFSGCYAEAGGGAIANRSSGFVRVANSTFFNNSQQYAFGNAGAPFGGGGAIGNTGSMHIDQCTFSNNWTRESNGGAVLNKGSVGVSASTFVGNHVRTNYMFGSGGAVASEGTAGLTNCTFTANHAPNGGSAVYGYPAPLSMIHCTVVGNVVTNPTLTYNHAVELASGSQVYNSIIAANDVWNSNTASWHTDNLVAPASTVSNNLVSTNNTYVGALSSNGGPVQTMPLFSGSAAVNYGTAAAGVTNDARGAARYEQPDAGAYELPTYAPIPLAPTSTVFVIGENNAFQMNVDSGLPTTFYLLAALPGGLTLSTNGLLSGNPSAPSGVYTLSIRAANDYHYTDFPFQLILSDGTTGDRFSWQLNGGAGLTNGVFTLTDGGGGEARSTWYLFQQDINAFEASFEYLAVSNNGIADGMAFVLQNDPSGVNALGGAGGGLGYLGITPSFALKLNLYAGAPGGSGIQIASGGEGLGTNTYINSDPASPASGDPIKVGLHYLNGLLDVTMTNLVSGLTYATNFSIDIPVAAGGNQAWVGMTAATGGETAYQYVSNFVFTSLSAVSTVIVNNASDPGGFNTNIIIGALGTNVTLRDAVNAANNNPGPVVIRFDPALGTTNISLLQTGDASAGNSALAVRGTIIIENTTGTNITIRRGAGGSLRLFRVLGGGNLTLRNLRLTEGNIGYDTNGGGIIRNDTGGSLTVDECFFSGGYAFYGGAIHNNGTSVVLRTTIQSCGARSGGGGIYNGGLLSVGASTIVSNTSEAYTGYWPGGGAIYCGGTTYVTNSTLAYNSAAGYYGGALSISGPTEVHHCTIAFNTALYGAPDIIGSMLAKNTIVTDGSYLGLSEGSTNNLIYNPGLGAFGDHGGPTYTFPITTNSAAFKGGATAAGVTTDQRGEPRHTLPDIGAYEIYPRDPLIVSTTVDENDGTADVEQGTGTSLREALAYAQSLSATQTITFASALGGQTVVLTNGWTGSGDVNALDVTNTISVKGLTTFPGITIAVGPGAQKRHFRVGTGGHLTVQDLTLTGGQASDYGASILNQYGALTIRRCTFAGNTSTSEGGAVHAWGGTQLLEIENSTFVSNTSANAGSAIVSGASSNAFKHLTVTGNSGPSTFYLFDCIVPLDNSIIAGNSADTIATYGAGAFSPASGGNLFGLGNAGGLSNGVNGNLTGLSGPELYLGGLSATNGGPTPTCALLPNTPAVNRGVDLGIATDQRGQVRVKSGLPDAGAYEMDLLENRYVNITNDEFNATSDPRFGAGTSLREALTFNSGALMDASMDGKTIVLSTVGDTNRGNSAIAVLSGSKFVSSSRPGITITCDGPEAMRAFRIAPGSEFGMYGLTLTGGNAPDGGAILNEGYLFVNYTTLAGNTATNAGGAVFTEANALSQFVNATLAGNTAGLWGGALANKGTNELSYITVSDNQGAIGGGGIFNYTGSRTKLLDTIVAGNRRPDNNPTQIAGPQPVTSDSAYNLIGNGEAVGFTNGVNNNIVGVADPKLGPLTNNGGRTPTMALLPGSPAIDAGFFLVSQAAVDQRSASRSGVPVDIGAYEARITTNTFAISEFTKAGGGESGGGTVTIGLSHNTGYDLSVYQTTNLTASPLVWTRVEAALETYSGSGQYRATIPVSTNSPRMFYRVQSP